MFHVGFNAVFEISTSFPSARRSAELHNVSFVSALTEVCPMFVGNGTLNKHAGVDYKQLSLLAKINDNQSGEVLHFHGFTLILS